MNGKQIFSKDKAYLIEAKEVLENGSEIEVRRALANVIYTCEEAIDVAKIMIETNNIIVNQTK